jgi:hypothetical protein
VRACRRCRATRPPPASRGCARPAPAGCSGATAWRWTRHAGAAGQRLTRGAVRLCADGRRPHRAGRHRRLPQSLLPDLRGRGPAGRRADRCCQQRPGTQLRRRLDAIDDATWARTQLLYVCSPGNPTGAVMPLSEWEAAVRAERPARLRDRQRRVLLRDLLPRRAAAGRAGSRGQAGPKRLPQPDRLHQPVQAQQRAGLRSGFVAGDARSSKPFLLYRTYHGSAMGPVVQAASVAAWNDEAHVVANRALYRTKFAQVTPVLADVLDVALPDAGFYLWAGVPSSGSAARRRHPLRPGPARSIQCGGAARQPAGAHRPGPQPGRRPHPHGPGGRRR